MVGKVSNTLREIREIREIRDLLREHGVILREHGAILREHGARLDAVETGLQRLGDRVVESELRTTTAIVDLHATLRDVRDLLAERQVGRDRLDDHERRIAALERRTG